MPDSSNFPVQWQRTFESIQETPGVVMTLGAPDSGKTTWVSSAVSTLASKQCLPLAVVDGDLGQTSLGPPATVALGLIQNIPNEGLSLNALPPYALYFVGSVSPRGHLLPTLVACTCLAEKAKQSGARIVLVDTSGFITSGAGFQLKLRKIELLDPRHLIVFQHQRELESLLSVVGKRKGIHIHRLDVSPFVRRRTLEERSRYRAKQFADYFADTTVLTVSLEHRTILAPPIRHSLAYLADTDVLQNLHGVKEEFLRGFLIGLNSGRNETLGLGLVERVHERENQLAIRTPLKAPSHLEILQLGSMRLTTSWQEVGL